jgi:hypothetical protein
MCQLTIANWTVAQAAVCTPARRDKARIASRALTQELEQLDAHILVAKNAEPTTLPEVDALVVPAWDQQREAIGSLFDMTTWEAVKDAVVLPAQVVRQLSEQQASGEVAGQILETLHLANMLARANTETLSLIHNGPFLVVVVV